MAADRVTDDPATETPDAPALSVVVPVFNEAENLRPLVADIRGALDGKLDYEIVYVDDGSTDDTPERLRALAAEGARLRTVRHRRRAGQSAAIASGVLAARAPLIATLDGDGQNDPGDIADLLRAFRAAPSENRARLLVTGQRMRRQDGWVKRGSSVIANRVRAWALRDETPDTGCGLKVFSRAAFLELPQFDHMHRFLPALVLRGGGSVITVPVSHRRRSAGRSKYGIANRLWVGIVDLLGVMWLRRRLIAPALEDTEKED